MTILDRFRPARFGCLRREETPGRCGIRAAAGDLRGRDVAIDELTSHAEPLLAQDPEKFRQLMVEAARQASGGCTPWPQMDPDPVAGLLYGYLDLMPDDRRKFRAMLQRADRKAARLGDGAA